MLCSFLICFYLFIYFTCCCNQIQADKKSNFSSDITWAIVKEQKIERKIAHILLKGLPGSGKTTLLDRLLNMPLREWYSSTGMCEGTVTVEVGPPPLTLHVTPVTTTRGQ